MPGSTVNERVAGGDGQGDAPIADAVESFLSEGVASFTTPGHKRAAWLSDPLLERDVPLATGADDSRLSQGVLARAQALAAELWSADFCRFSVSGSTHCNQAFCLALGAPGDKVAVSRALHKSTFAGLVLAGLEPVWMHPEVDPASGIAVGLSLRDVERALKEGVSAVLVVEPSYLGVMSDLPAIIELAHSAGVPVIVDQAWGSHLGLHPALPRNAMQMGADGMVISAHKTLAAFTQGALLLTQGSRLDRVRLDGAFETLNTTSPSASIYGSIDRSRQLMAAPAGRELLARALDLARGFRVEIADVQGLSVLDEQAIAHHPTALALDPLKLVLSLAGTGADGFAVERDLWEAGLRLEMADRETIVPLLTIGDDETSVGRLSAALRESLERRRRRPREPAASTVWRLRAEIGMLPREAFFAPHERVAASAAVGRISAETAAPYPPGIPALAPGEVVTAELLEALQAEAAAGSRVAYCSDPTLQTLLVVAR
ncbi:MAG: aminotransferase class V-fold PLP-dependent enzyme [Solirubrobacteraceae bacterium]|nr:aminotransferase class V-fold PLP-dependent enzyme [Solirubrobacteraceae bacterium]